MKNRDADPAKKTDGSDRPKLKRSNEDRRSGRDRRDALDIGYFVVGGEERRRKSRERRQLPERREGWIRVTQWSSLYVGDDAPKMTPRKKK